jgi:K(+)-stimulated pyrophosphate-energized sodium pump
MNILIKLMSIVSLVIAPTLAQLYSNGNPQTVHTQQKTVIPDHNRDVTNTYTIEKKLN